MTDLKVGSPGVGLRWSLSPEQVEEPAQTEFHRQSVIGVEIST